MVCGYGFVYEMEENPMNEFNTTDLKKLNRMGLRETIEIKYPIAFWDNIFGSWWINFGAYEERIFDEYN